MTTNYNEKDKNMCMFEHKKFMTKNAPSKIIILHNHNTFKHMVNLYFCFVFETHLIEPLLNTYHAFTFVPSYSLCI